MRIYIIAGEASGDRLGAQAMRDLRVKYGSKIEFFGIGGTEMQSEGLTSLFPMEELSVMGVFEIVPKLMQLLKRIKQTIYDIEEKAPDFILTIDSPDFSFRVQKAVHERCKIDVKQVHYVAPTVWAWRPGRAKKIAKFLDGLLCLLPFEPPYFEKENLPAAFAGHPIMRSDLIHASGDDFRARHNIHGKALGLFLGSRQGEVDRMGAVMRAAVDGLGAPLILPTLPHVRDKVQALFADYDGPVVITSDPAEKWQAFKACDGALAISGTVGLELAVADIPHVIGYAMSPLTAAIIRRVIQVKYAHLGNIMMDAPIIPEAIQNDFTPQRMQTEARKLLQGVYDDQKESFATIRQNIQPPSDKALADFINTLL